MNPEQFKYLVIEPVTLHLSMSSKEANDLLLGTALLESNLEHVSQMGNGPALSLFQIEPNTLYDVYKNYLDFRSVLRDRVDSLLYGKATPENRIRNLSINPHYACAIARIVYRRVPKALPDSSHGDEDYVKELASYWKNYYNTPLGAGTIKKAIETFTKII